MARVYTTTAILAVFAALPAFAQMACEGLTADAVGLEGTRITDAATIAADENGPARCVVHGSTAERTGADGKDYALRFELALPDDWNGNYVHQFNGGNDGEVKPATGALNAGTGADSPLARGYAVVSSDAGHDGTANPDAGLAGGARFGFDEEARRMYGYGAVSHLDPLARAAVEAYYSNGIDHAYGVGCSNGGRHAMVAASRMPDAFDGLLVGAPGFNLPRAALQHALDVQSLKPVTGDLASAFSPEDLGLVATRLRETCDGLDGLEDGLIGDTAACQAQFQPQGLVCTEGQNEGCLNAAQVAALETIHAGPKARDGSGLYSDWSWDAGIEGRNWRMWKLESPIPPWDHKPIIAVMGASSLAQVFTVPPTEVAGDPASLEEFLIGFDLAERGGDIHATSDDYPLSPMEIMTPPGSDDPDLAAFRDAGGKIVLFHGVSDPVFSVNDTATWYERLDANNGGNAGEFARLYPVPGMNHCVGGPATDAFDLFTALTGWVERGETPQAVVASARPDNEELPEGLIGASRPLWPAPQVARYQGGDPKSADSFTCVAH